MRKDTYQRFTSFLSCIDILQVGCKKGVDGHESRYGSEFHEVRKIIKKVMAEKFLVEALKSISIAIFFYLKSFFDELKEAKKNAWRIGQAH